MKRPLGTPIKDFPPVPIPRGLALDGTWASLRPLDSDRDASALFGQLAGHDWLWDYLFEPAQTNKKMFAKTLGELEGQNDKYAYVIRAKNDPQPLGYACFWTTVSQMGSNEIGNVLLSPALQNTPIATDAFFLMNDWVFANGYRRMEWKCNALNAPSRRAAQRLGFSFEGVFRNHLVVKGRNRDTAWFAMTNEDWTQLKPAYEKWLSPCNFDEAGQQHVSLSSLTKPHLFKTDPQTK